MKIFLNLIFISTMLLAQGEVLNAKNIISKDEIASLKDPFFMISTNTNFKDINNKNLNIKTTLKLMSIMPESVKIDEKWLKIGDSINGYKLVNITKNSAILKIDNKKIVLKIPKEANVKLEVK